jgi:predicted RNA-binding Zn-ribbon protein involved in translation (DUF1610 family)
MEYNIFVTRDHAYALLAAARLYTAALGSAMQDAIWGFFYSYEEEILMKCTKCGSEIPEEAKFCPVCGTPASAGADNTRQTGQQFQGGGQQYQQQWNGQAGFNPNNVPPEYKPISMWGYFGYELLFSIPIVGLIVLIVFSFTHKNVNVKNFARSYFCYLIVILIIIAILGGIGGCAAAMTASEFY